ncbi:histidine-rich glycoprotein-like [Leguminivora glycinivorella]|uniref:histidine-rich glycoprotein-like n=1 Tax=Leguminivora glycinivorella TaxID=1035111 RepID=UPI00200F4FDD|nr:histidine-rich glycoprotein-like [Leguminivora glycinivorella]
MILKAVCLLALAAIAAAQHEHHHGYSSQYISKHDGHAQVVTIKDHHGHEKHIDYYTHPKYEFKYKVDDDHTGDHKTQHEHRDGDDTKSNYHVDVKHIVPHHHH